MQPQSTTIFLRSSPSRMIGARMPLETVPTIRFMKNTSLEFL